MLENKEMLQGDVLLQLVSIERDGARAKYKTYQAELNPEIDNLVRSGYRRLRDYIEYIRHTADEIARGDYSRFESLKKYEQDLREYVNSGEGFTATGMKGFMKTSNEYLESLNLNIRCLEEIFKEMKGC